MPDPSIWSNSITLLRRLRIARDTQYEIRVSADTIYKHFFTPALPWTAEAFVRMLHSAPPAEED